jgi:ADP-dependent NAD(P)H-hydrate dehydratase / NAD(P)H-hydrate epimerase
MRLVTVREMRALEQQAMQAGTSEAELMERAGTAVAEALVSWLPRTAGRRVLVLTGRGNNGGDALIAARWLRDRHGARPLVYLAASREADPLLRWTEAGDVPVLVHSYETAGTLREWLAQADIVLDGLLGIGARLPVTGAIGEVLAACQEISPSGQRRVAVDIPTGVQADTGQADDRAFRAHLTLATGPAKPGLFIAPGAEHAGRVRALDIGLAVDEESEESARVYRMGAPEVAALLPSRSDDSHKGTFGKLLIIAGSDRYVGAAYLTGAAAVRVGAGLVTLAVPAHAQMAIAGASPEMTFLPVPDDPAAPGRITPAHLDMLGEAVTGYDAVAIGPGLGPAPETQRFVQLLVDRLASDDKAPPLVIDADGLNALASADGWVSPETPRWVLTPHPGEMGRLTKTSAKEVQSDRLTVARIWAAKWRQVVVLKGAPSIVARPDGGAHLSVFANAALAIAGTGDVLTGAIAGLLAQGLEPYDAAVAGAYLHGLAGELWRSAHGAAGLPASELAAYLPPAQNSLRRMG